MTTVLAAKPRLASLDQFRGYTVAGMFFVNFLAGYHGWVPAVLHHHHNYCSYADTIMPQFLFAVGFAMRLSFGRRVQSQGLLVGHWRMVRRIVGLFLVSFAIYTEGHVAGAWQQLTEMGPWEAVFPFLKRHWLQTLGQIAMTSLWILPVIRASATVRIVFLLASAAAHVYLSHLFNYHWVNSDPNGIDGGPLGFLTWTIPAILGTLTCDAILDAPGRPPLARLTGIALVVMALGYVFSCGTRLYDLSPTELTNLKDAGRVRDAERRSLNDQRARVNAEIATRRASLKSSGGDPKIDELQQQAADLNAKVRSLYDIKLAPSPVIPPTEAWRGRTWRTLLAEPPFVPPPEDDPRIDPPPHEMHRYWNYWMMTQRAGSLSYLTFSAGFALLVYVLFYVLSDMLKFRIGVFRTFGTNALAAYVLAGMIGTAIKTFIPGDAPPWYVITAFCIDFLLIWLFVRTLEKNGIFLRV